MAEEILNEQNLKPCKYCGKQISKLAKQCPNCGKSLKSSSSVRSLLIFLLGLLIIYKLAFFSLFSLTDKYVDGLDTKYEHYGIIGVNPELTVAEFFQVKPIGRLINVRIQHAASDIEYETLKQILKLHYYGNKKVNDVYRCKAGTLMIDCRGKSY